MFQALFRWLAGLLMAPAFRYSIPAYSLRALFQAQHGEDVLDRAVLLLAINGVEGDWLEFGVFEGRSLRHAWHSHRWVEHLVRSGGVPVLAGLPLDSLRRRRFFGFDSFAGLPEPRDPDHGSWLGRGALAAPLERVLRALRRSRIPSDRVRLVPGWFESTLTEATRGDLGLERVAAVHIDCDFGEPAALALEFVEPLLVDGAVVIFDDWWLYRGRPDRGEQRAFGEFLIRHPRWRATELLRGTTLCFVLHLAEAPAPAGGGTRATDVPCSP